ncbi:MAG: oxidoreductase [Clostridia bacterium]|nr:oxidoreductase [Clostridia bacterium]
MSQIKFGIVGTSPIAKKFIMACKDIPEILIYGVYSRTEEMGSQFAKEMNIPHVFTNYKAMLETEDIDAVYVASPNAYHFEHVDLALEYHKHILCEKPFTSNSKELNCLIEKAKDKKFLMMEAMKPLAMPTYHTIKENLNKIGEVRKIVFNFCQYSSKYPAFLKGENPNIFNPEFSAGALMDIGIYCIYPCIDLFGMPKSMKCNANKLANGIDGSGSILFDYQDKEAVIMYSKMNDSSLGSEIMGELGSMFIDHISSPTRIELRQKGKESEIISEGLKYDPMYYEVREFTDVLLEGKTESDKYSYKLSCGVMSVLDEVRRQVQVIFPADKSL